MLIVLLRNKTIVLKLVLFTEKAEHIVFCGGTLCCFAYLCVRYLKEQNLHGYHGGED